MGTSCAFKTTASLIKPTRESLLDYCSYTLIVLAFIGILRVIIGAKSLREGCIINDDEFVNVETLFNGHELGKFRGSGMGGNETIYMDENSKRPSSLDILIDSEFDLDQFDTTYDGNRSKEDVTAKKVLDDITLPANVTSRNNVSQNEYRASTCTKYYQSVFAYVLLVESLLLLMSGLLWAKVPKVSMTVQKFTTLIHTCERSGWANHALKVITNKRTNTDISQSLYSFISSEILDYDMRSLLDTLFHPDSEYQAKAKARHLYEKVQTFCLNNNDVSEIWNTYVIKSTIQFALWIIIFNVNLVLFVLLQFYVKCSEDPKVGCDHDEFLRIIWFMAETLMLIYGVFNFKTLKWINEKAVVRRKFCDCCSFRCLYQHTALDKSNDVPLLTCRPYVYDMNQPVYNDTALLLHLLEEAHPKILPYFVVFMFDEWKEKLTSFANSVQISELPIRSSMQMLSGRPPPIIEITDVAFNPRAHTTSLSSSRKKHGSESSAQHKPSVTFYFDSESLASSDNENQGRQRTLSSGSGSSLTVPPRIPAPNFNKGSQSQPPLRSTPQIVSKPPSESKPSEAATPLPIRNPLVTQIAGSEHHPSSSNPTHLHVLEPDMWKENSDFAATETTSLLHENTPVKNSETSDCGSKNEDISSLSSRSSETQLIS